MDGGHDANGGSLPRPSLGAGTTSGLRLVVGDRHTSPLGGLTDVKVATADGRRLLRVTTTVVRM